MASKILLTSFQTWLKHQKTNSSDDLLDIINRDRLQHDTLDPIFFLRQLPVEIDLAKRRTIDAVEIIKPQGIICCGMAESRNQLSLESNATTKSDRLYTSLNLDKLVSCLHHTDISHEAGKFVCEGLYYQVLKYIKSQNYRLPCVFAHIPVLTSGNTKAIVEDINIIIRFMQLLD